MSSTERNNLKRPIRCKICGFYYDLEAPPHKNGHFRVRPPIGRDVPCESEYPKDWEEDE